MAHNPYSAPQAQVADAPDSAVATDGPSGIGGWLVLPLIGLIVTPIRVGLGVVTDLLPALQPEVWSGLTVPGSAAYHPLWAPAILFEVGANVVLIAFSLALLWLFLRKSARVPSLMVFWFLTIVGVQIVDLMLISQIPAVAEQGNAQSLGELARSVLGAAIWIPYFLRSRRVRNTFVRT